MFLDDFSELVNNSKDTIIALSTNKIKWNQVIHESRLNNL